MIEKLAFVLAKNIYLSVETEDIHKNNLQNEEIEVLRYGIECIINMIKIITTDFKEGQIFTGTVVSIKEFGAFIEFAPGKEGMVHISKIAKERIEHVEDVLTLGDVVKVVCLGKDKMGRISFSIKDVPADQK